MPIVETSFADALAELNRNNCENLTSCQMSILQRAIVTLKKSGIEDQCLQVGETAPDFSFQLDNSESTLSQLLQQGPLVLNFFRGFWCSFCQVELHAFETALGEFEQLGVQYVAISPQHSQETQLEHPNYQIITDADNKIAHQFRIVYEIDQAQKELYGGFGTDLAAINRSDRWELPLAATYLINTDRTIQFSYTDPDFRKRIDPKELVDFIKEKIPL